MTGGYVRTGMGNPHQPISLEQLQQPMASPQRSLSIDVKPEFIDLMESSSLDSLSTSSCHSDPLAMSSPKPRITPKQKVMQIAPKPITPAPPPPQLIGINQKPIFILPKPANYQPAPVPSTPRPFYVVKTLPVSTGDGNSAGTAGAKKRGRPRKKIEMITISRKFK